MNPTPRTPLLCLLEVMSKEERELFASLSGTAVNYLYQIGGMHRKRIGVDKAFAIEDASRELNKRTKGRLPIVTARMLADTPAFAGLLG